jgi:predicted ATPase
MAGSAPLIGHQNDLDRLAAVINAARDGPAKLLLEGEAGVGKTALWRAAVERAHELGFRVIEARPVAAESDLSFAALGDLLSGLEDEIGSLPAPQRRALRIALMLEEADGELAEPHAVGASILGLLRRLSGEKPLVIALDDIQWLDLPSVRALQFALRRLDKEPVLVLATTTFRTEGTIDAASARRGVWRESVLCARDSRQPAASWKSH